MFVCGGAALAGLWEVGDTRWPSDGTPPELSRAMLDLYPDDATMQYQLGAQAVKRGDFEKALEHFENGIATGVKTDQNLLYFYAATLVHLKADPAQIDQAVTRWKENYPGSTLPDPRTTTLNPAETAPRRY